MAEEGGSGRCSGGLTRGRARDRRLGRDGDDLPRHGGWDAATLPAVRSGRRRPHPRRQWRRQGAVGCPAAALAPARGGRAQPQARRGAGYARRVAVAALWCGGLACDGVSFAFLCGTLWNIWGPELRPGTAASATAELGACAGAVRCNIWDGRPSTSAAVSWPYHVGNHGGGLLGCCGHLANSYHRYSTYPAGCI